MIAITDAARRAAIESRAAQGLPPTVEDAVALARIAALLLGRPVSQSGKAA